MSVPAVRALPLAAALALLLAGVEAPLAQTIDTMPMPPSASDPLPKGEATPKKPPRAKRQPARTRATAGDDNLSASSGTGRTSAPQSRGANDTSMRERIDTRGAKPDIQLEDDPRAVQPTLQNGRAGVGMRF